jgi:glyoxylase-like metal-dependent hydrolase (beta-lactamase superfamily II)
MIFNQFFDEVSSTYTYLLSSGKGREALIIDPVIEKTDEYILYLKKLDLKLVKVIDTHIHADHISGMQELHKQTDCVSVMGENSLSEVVNIKVKDNEKIKIDNIELTSMHTPGHTDCSYSFLMKDRIFTGDTLLINGTGRTDFQNGSPIDQYHSLFDRILKLPEKMFVYPAHDYKGNKVSTIGEQKRNNPRLKVKSADQYVKIMNSLNLENPTMMDIAVPANIKGKTLDQIKKE